MPTPFMHIDYAERMLRSPQLSAASKASLSAELPAFYLGSIAADYQSICDVPRETTHFYPVPLPPEHDAISRLFAENSDLAKAASLASDRASFVAGYIAHLNFDLVWYREIMLPFFVFNDKWEGVSRGERFTVHNILLTFLDRQAKGVLPVSAEKTLCTGQSPTNIDFLDPEQVGRFQTLISDQLAPDALSRTVEVYAERMGITPAEFGQHLDDADWMQTRLFDRVPLESVLTILERTVHNSAELITAYLTD